MSLFDPLYQVEETEPPSLEEIQKLLEEFDGSGSGLMSARQMFAACKEINNLGFDENQLKNYVKEGQDVAGDGNGRIKLVQFASYIAFEAKKKYKKNSNNNNNNNNNQQSQPQQTDNYSNPFMDFMSNDAPKPLSSVQKTKSLNIVLTPDPNQTKEQASSQPVDMSASYSPTQADPSDMPDWFGHSQDTIQNHPSQPSTADPFGFFDDDNKMNATNNDSKPHHISIATQDILFADDDTTSSNGVNRAPNLSPRKAKEYKTKTKPKHTKQTSAGLIAPPRSKGDKQTKKSKKRASKTGPIHATSASFSFAEHFSDDMPFSNGTGGTGNNDDNKPKKKKKEKKYGKEALSLKKAHSEAVPETTHKLQPKKEKNGKKKRPKIDAIVEMKRGAAMLKYGRRGFPHFRRFQISHDLTKLLWYSRKKNLSETHVSVKDMKDILEGQQTEVFKQCTQKTLEKASFSIIYGSKLKSLDVVAKSAEEAQLWIKGLKGLIKANQQGKLHKVVQILVDVDFKDISKTKYKHCTDDERRKYEIQHKNRPELVHTISTTLEQSKKIFQSLTKISQTNNVQNSNEFENVQLLTSEIEERLEEISHGLTNNTADLTDLKRDVWVLKVDVTVLEEKVKVLSKIKSSIPI